LELVLGTIEIGTYDDTRFAVAARELAKRELIGKGGF